MRGASRRGTLCAVLGYHEVAPLEPHSRRSLVVTPTAFASHLAYLRLAGFRSVHLPELVCALQGESSLPVRSVVLTFDDGYIGNYRYAFPLLRRFGYTATVFVPSGLVGQARSRGDAPPTETMNLCQLHELIEGGLSIGAHTRTHADLPTLEPDEMWQEVQGGRRELEAMLDRPVDTFAFPYGRYNGTAVDEVRAAGYVAACTTRYGTVRSDDDRYTLHRVMIGNNIHLPSYVYRLWRAGNIRQATARAVPCP